MVLASTLQVGLRPHLNIIPEVYFVTFQVLSQLPLVLLLTMTYLNVLGLQVADLAAHLPDFDLHFGKLRGLAIF